MFFSRRTDWPEGQNRLALLAESFREEGRSFIDLTQSNPTVCGFPSLNAEWLEPFSNPNNLTYEPDPKGLLAARQAVSRYYLFKNIRVSPERIVLTSSTSEAYAFLFKLLLNPGEKIAVPAPSYPLLDSLAALSDVGIVRWRDFKILEVFERTKALCVVNPNNPAGNFVHQDEKDFLNRYAAKHHAALISDEVFLDFPHTDKAETQSFAGNSEVLTFTLSGISKILALPQMKLSWIVVSGPEREAREALRRLEIIADTYLSVNTPSQIALADWLERRGEIQEEILARVRHNKAFLTQNLKDQASVLNAEGGWQAVVRVESDDESLALEFLEKSEVLTHPGYLYDFEAGDHLVLSLLPEPQKFEEGVRRLAAFLDRKAVSELISTQ